jgi:hypothetical protein
VILRSSNEQLNGWSVPVSGGFLNSEQLAVVRITRATKVLVGLYQKNWHVNLILKVTGTGLLTVTGP